MYNMSVIMTWPLLSHLKTDSIIAICVYISLLSFGFWNELYCFFI